MRIFAFPYAGGGASIYRQWWEHLPAEVDFCPVQLPGRETRLSEKPYKSMPELIAALTAGLASYVDMPCALFGHSMGAHIAFEYSHVLQRENHAPRWLFVSGQRGPQIPRRKPPKHLLPDDEFVEELTQYERGVNEALEHPELRELFLPILRADFEIVETYKPSTLASENTLSCPISAFGGEADEDVLADDLEAWRQQTASLCKVEMFPGGHFFLKQQMAPLLAAINGDLRQALSVL